MYALPKKFIIRLFCLLFLIGLHFSHPVHAAEPVAPAQWQQLTNDKAFNYKDDKETVKPPEPSNNGLLLRLFQAIFDFFRAASFFIWIIIIGVLLFVLYKIFASNGAFMFGKNKKVMKDTGPPQIEEEDIASTNWEALLQQAVANGDLRLAVRYRYMWLLQLLQKRELIQYRSDKTNYEYYSELSDTSYKQPFKQLSRQYEYVWYGNFALPTTTYSEYSDLFNNLKKQLGA
jgi:hypothetical protein